MVQATTLVAWLGVQDCRHIKEYPAGKGGVILSTLEQTGATRLVLLSVLQPSLAHAYLESLSLAWPGEIALHSFENATVEMATLWPWAQAAITSSLPLAPDGVQTADAATTPVFLLGTALPACQAVFLAHGMSGAPCRLIEPRRDGALQTVSVPLIVSSAERLQDIEPVPDAQEWGVEEVALQPISDLEFPEQLDDDLREAAEPVDVEDTSGWNVDEVALQPVTEIDFDSVSEGEAVEESPEAQAAPVETLAGTDFDMPATEEAPVEEAVQLEAALDSDFDIPATEEALVEEAVQVEAAFDSDFDIPVTEEAPVEEAVQLEAAFDSDFDIPATVEAAAEEAPAAEADMTLDFPDVAADALDFDAELGKTGSLAEEMPEKADEIERLQAEFNEGDPLGANAAELPEMDPFEAAQAALSDGAAQPSANAQGVALDDDLFDVAQAEPSAQPTADLGEIDPFEAAQAALTDVAELADTDLQAAAQEGATPAAEFADPFEAAQAEFADVQDADPFEVVQSEFADAQTNAAFEQPAQAEPAEQTQQAEQPALASAPKDAPHAAPWPYASESLSVLVRRADTVAATPSPVLILGEAGSGGRLLATRIHERSDRKDGPIILADLAAIHVDAQASELWGESEMLTGAHTAGYVELARGGTLLLAGLELMSPLVQSQLLNLMARGDYMPVGAQEPVPADVRVIAVAADTLLAELKAGRFNRPLFDQFGRGLLTIPALHKRPQDLPALLDAMWFHVSDTEARAMRLGDDAREWLLDQGFAGTVRDLELALRRAVLWTRGDEVNAETLKESLALASVPQAVANCTQAIQAGFSLKDVVFSVTKHFVHQALVQSAYNLDEAAALLGVADSQALLGWMARVDIVLPRNLDEAAKSMPQATFDSVSDEFVSGQAAESGMSDELGSIAEQSSDAHAPTAPDGDSPPAPDEDLSALAAQIDF